MTMLRLTTFHVTESFDSVMEQYDQRMTNTDSDDDQIQKMFLTLTPLQYLGLRASYNPGT